MGGSWDGTLSSTGFEVSAREFADKWATTKPSSTTHSSWVWVNHIPKRPVASSHVVQGYLSLEKFSVINSTQENLEETGCIGEGDFDGCVSGLEEALDSATLVQSIHLHHPEVHFYDFHIIYSDSYRVPVLYFRGYDTNGRPLLSSEIEMDLPRSSTNVLLESKWTFITQEEHPYLSRPWYKLHPCGTSEWMKLLHHDNLGQVTERLPIEQYLVSWFQLSGRWWVSEFLLK